MKRVLLFLLVALIGLNGCGGAATPEADGPPVAPIATLADEASTAVVLTPEREAPPATSTEEDEAAAPELAPDAATAEGEGEGATGQAYELTVNRTERTTDTSELLIDLPSGSVVFLADVTLENASTEALSVSPFYFRLVDRDGAVYVASPFFVSFLTDEALPAREALQGELAFVVPSDSGGFILQHNPTATITEDSIEFVDPTQTVEVELEE